MTFLTQAAAVTADPADRVTVLERLGRAAASAARPDVAAVHLTEAIELRREMGDEPGRYRAMLWLAEGYMSGRMVEKAVPVLEEAVAYGANAADEADFAAIIALLARARSQEQRLHEAVALADRALEIAERLDLYEVIAGALITKGGILCSHGRPVEGLSLISAARELANDYTLPTVESRALTNLTIVMASRDVRATWDLEMDALAFARRIGRRDTELTIVGNAGEDAVRLGYWDWIAHEVAAYDDVDLPAALQLGMGFAAIVPRILRGDPDVGASIDAMRAATADALDSDFGSSRSDLEGWIALASGDFAAARDALADAGGSERHERPIRPAARREGRDPGRRRRRGARRARPADAQRHARSRPRCRADDHRGRDRRRWRDGRPRRSPGTARRSRNGPRWGCRGTRPGPRGAPSSPSGRLVPEARAWGAATRAIFEQLGAKPLLAQLDAAMGTEGDADACGHERRGGGGRRAARSRRAVLGSRRAPGLTRPGPNTRRSHC